MGSSYDETQRQEHALKSGIAQVRDSLRYNAPVEHVARDLVDLAEGDGRALGYDLEGILAMFGQRTVSVRQSEIPFLARSLAKKRASGPQTTVFSV